MRVGVIFAGIVGTANVSNWSLTPLNHECGDQWIWRLPAPYAIPSKPSF
jgi:hypothetical protein